MLINIEMKSQSLKVQKCHDLITNLRFEHSNLDISVNEQLNELLNNKNGFEISEGFDMELHLESYSASRLFAFVDRFKTYFPGFFIATKPITRHKLTVLKSPHNHKEARDQSLTIMCSICLLFKNVQYRDIIKVHYFLTQTLSSIMRVKLKIC